MSEISYPPFPRDITTTMMMYRHLDTLRSWAEQEAEAIKALLSESDLPAAEKNLALPQMATALVWEGTSIADKYQTLVAVQQIRAGWDALVREYETVWDSPPAVRRRYSFVLSAVGVLKNAFINPEVRELQDEQWQRVRQNMQQTMSNLTIIMQQPPDMQEGASDENR